MAEALKCLGQQLPAQDTLTNLYETPTAKSAVVSSIVICNQNRESVTFRLAHAIAAAADARAQYLYYDQIVPPQKTFIATIGMTLAGTDVIRCKASRTNVSFNVYGSEVTP